MVKELQRDHKTVYACEECGFIYEDREWAEKCEAFCAEHGACNLEIMEHGTPPD